MLYSLSSDGPPLSFGVGEGNIESVCIEFCLSRTVHSLPVLCAQDSICAKLVEDENMLVLAKITL